MGIGSNFKFDLGFHLCRSEGMGVAGTNYRRDCDLSRHPNWYIVYNPKLNPQLEWCILNYPSQIISPILLVKRFLLITGLNIFLSWKSFSYLSLFLPTNDCRGYIFKLSPFTPMPTTLIPVKPHCSFIYISPIVLQQVFLPPDFFCSKTKAL